MGIFLNDLALYPFHLFQKMFLHSENALVIYVECRPAREPGESRANQGQGTSANNS